MRDKPGNTKGGSITVLLTSCFTGLEWSVLQIKTKIVSCHTANSKRVKQEVKGTVILPPLVFPGQTLRLILPICKSERKKRFYKFVPGHYQQRSRAETNQKVIFENSRPSQDGT